MRSMPHPQRIATRGLDLYLLYRPCQFASGVDCWLCRDLRNWNKVLQLVNIELIETEPGRLSLRSTALTNRRECSDEGELHDVAYVFSWLPKAHRCIQTIKLDGSQTVFIHRAQSAVALALGRSVNVRHLALWGSYNVPRCENWLVEGLAALSPLESFAFGHFTVSVTVSRCLVDLVSRNASHLTNVIIKDNHMSQNVTNRLLRALHSCRDLTQLSFMKNSLGNECMNTLARIIRVCKSLRKLDLSDSLQDDVNLNSIAEALISNTSLRELYFFQCEADAVQCQTDFSKVFEALTVNKTLKHLDLCGCNINNRNAAALATALQSNTGLQRLDMMYAQVDDSCAVQLAGALYVNYTLEILNLKRNFLSVHGVAAFCKILGKNRTLKSVLFSEVGGSEQERQSLSLQMAQNEGYSRIHMIWEEPDIPQLTAAVALATESPTELHLSDTDGLMQNAICALLGQLATNTYVKVVTMETSCCLQTFDALCTALALNQTIQHLEVAVTDESSDYGLLSRVARALIPSRSVSVVHMRSFKLSLRSVKSIAVLLSKNICITKFSLKVIFGMRTKRAAILSRALARNRTIMDFELPCYLDVNCVSFRILNALRKNTESFNLAISFLTQRRLDRQAAKAFEELDGRSSLIPQIMKVAELTSEQMKASLRWAEHYIRSNYLRLTGVVQTKVICCPRNGTQLDTLNQECWCAIARYLSLSDVISPKPDRIEGKS